MATEFGIFIEGELAEDGFVTFEKALKCAKEDYEEDDYEIYPLCECGSSHAQGVCTACDAEDWDAEDDDYDDDYDDDEDDE
jgi:hypothetical protein